MTDRAVLNSREELASDAEPCVRNLVLARQNDDNPALLFEDQEWTWRQHVSESAARNAWLRSLRVPGPFHIGVMLDNVPEFSFLLGAAGLGGHVIVGLNPTRRGAELQGDLARTDCQMIITESRHLELLDSLTIPFESSRIFNIDDDAYATHVQAHTGASPPDDAVDPADPMMLIFTSGTSGEAKAVRVTQRRIAGPGIKSVARGAMSAADVAYVSMPLFHSACMLAAWSPVLACGATMVFKRRFSASGFLPDIRRYGVTYFHYVGKPLAYILDTPAHEDDSDNPLRIASGNEAADLDIGRFADRFGCQVFDGFGSTEGGIVVARTPDTPRGSLGRPGEGVDILTPGTGRGSAVAIFDDAGRLANPDEAIGELVNTTGAGSFEGYYNNSEATAERMRDGMYWSGDMAYRDAEGFVYFAGRSIEWLRVDGENFAAAPVERVLARHPAVSQVAVYAVPALVAGDDVMATIKLLDGAAFDPAEFEQFLDGQTDLGTKWRPRYVRIAKALPETQTNKVLKRELAHESWATSDPVWWRPERSAFYDAFTDDDRVRLREQFHSRGRGHLTPP